MQLFFALYLRMAYSVKRVAVLAYGLQRKACSGFYDTSYSISWNRPLRRNPFIGWSIGEHSHLNSQPLKKDQPDSLIFVFLCTMQESVTIAATENSKGAFIFKKMLEDKKAIQEHIRKGGKIADLKDTYKFVKPLPTTGK